ncbi:polysaccharide biosynthesis tyrosine autokinase [Phormidium sp. LEGE 05292]|uniref:GumC family protein n=1 Tax=[Phormidium] sp. LEGE 05292 TaxID=767427 RepID=UPI001882E641|nr:tyrosine-protein kinase domain-containing protein [Phormidium sp. LEGE 05292]MBE9228697.1 polysaccharide biosynthesis tyrosine autokinase [Phormidium sp. LEGE 05292]
MENEQQLQKIAIPAASHRRFQRQPQANYSQLGKDTDDEGGLNLGQVVDALRRRVLIIVGMAVVVAVASSVKARDTKPIYQASFEILTKPVTVETQVISSVPQTLSSNKDGQQAPTKGVDPTKLKVLKSPSVLSPIAKKLESEYPDIGYDEIASNLVVTPDPASEILAVSYQDKDPKKVKEILDLVAQAYLKYSLEERLADVQQGIQFVEAQLPQLQKRVEIIQDQLQKFRQQYNLIDPDSQGKQLTDQIAKVGQQRFDIQVKLNETQTIYQNLKQELAKQKDSSAASSVLSGNANYQKLLTQIQDIEAQAAKDASVFQELSPKIQVLRDQEKNLLPLLKREGQRVEAELAAKIRELEAQNQFLAQTEKDLIQKVKQLSAVSREYTDIQRELKISTDNLDQFLTKREALRIDAGQRKTPWQILTPPTNPTPSSADVKRSGILGAVLGLLLGVGVALLLEKLSNAIRSVDQLKPLIKLPILGVIPHNKALTGEKQELISFQTITSAINISALVKQIQQRFGLKSGHHGMLKDYTKSAFIEAFRSLHTNILLLSPDARIRSIIISSSMPGEGKSTVSIYLAQAAAVLGQRVLLVDADLRLPKLHQRLELDNSFGLSTLIASENLDFDMVVQSSYLDSNLSVLTSGQVPPDSTKLLSSKKMQSLMQKFEESYDLVIYDMPPFGLADVKILAPKVDGIVMVVGLNKLKVSLLTKTLEELRSSAINVLGIVANGSKDQDSSINSYNQYYDSSTQSPVFSINEPKRSLDRTLNTIRNETELDNLSISNIEITQSNDKTCPQEKKKLRRHLFSLKGSHVNLACNLITIKNEIGINTLSISAIEIASS